MIRAFDTKCTGCTACVHICPTDAISMVYNNEGFLYPIIDDDVCIKCDACSDVCQINGFQRFKAPDVCYAAWSSNDAAKKVSSSGGLFYELAKKTLQQNGLVCGAAFVDNFAVRHIIIDNEEELPRLQGSKYVQSDPADCFPRIKDALEKGTPVLFSGTGCQVAGLKKYLPKDYDNLLTADLVCHGTPSPLVYKTYLKELEAKYGKFDGVSFRDKLYGWDYIHSFAIWRGEDPIMREPVGINIYLTAFLREIILRKICYSCPFASLSRCGDITLGDFWMVHKHKAHLDNNKGTSLILVNGAKGKAAIEAIRDNVPLFEAVDPQIAVRYNGNLKSPSKEPKGRTEFFTYFETEKKVTPWFDKEFNRVGILNFHYANNIGAVLVAYSLAKVINNLGYYAEIINFRSSGTLEKNAYEEFRTRYIPQSKICRSTQELNKLAHRKIVVGSDQIWRLGATDMFMLSWASGYKSFTAYAASFGDNEYAGSINKAYAKYLLQRFDSISVREDTGVRICNETFGVHATHVLDPTFLLPISDYENLIANAKIKIKTPKKYIFVWCYSNENNYLLNHDKTLFKDLREYEVIDGWKLKSPSIEEILSIIKNASYVITDSFHVTVFSIMFNKSFLSLLPKGFNGQARIPSLLYGLNLQDRVRTNLLDVDRNSLENPIDYMYINNVLDKKRNESLKFLKDALEKNIFVKEPVDTEYFNEHFWKSFVISHKDSIPFFLRHSIELSHPYFQFFLHGVGNDTHYEISKPSQGRMGIALHCENKAFLDNPKNIDAIKALAKVLAADNFEFVQTNWMIGIRKTIQLDTFDMDFSKLVYQTYFPVLELLHTPPQEEVKFFAAWLQNSTIRMGV